MFAMRVSFQIYQGGVVILRFTTVQRTFSPLRYPLQPSFWLAPESSVVISYYCNGAGKHRFRLAPE